MTVTGFVEGGIKPISGSAVTLFQAAASPGGAPVRLATAKTDKNGAYTIRLAALPSAGSILYLAASGGDAGGGPNQAIMLMAILGPPATATVTINEVSTVAAAYVASNFITNKIDIADSSLHSLASAVSAIGNIVNLATGAAAGPISTAPNDSSRLNTLANALANCVQATAAAPACTDLFAAAANSPPPPVDTMGAIIDINKSPANHVTDVFDVAANGPYTPALDEPPTDWTLAINYGAGGLSTPVDIAVEASGNAWIANLANSVTVLTPAGAPLAGSPLTGNGLNAPEDLAIDGSGNVWVTNSGASSVSAFTSSGAPLTGSPFISTFMIPQGIAADAQSNIWVANAFSDGVTEFSAANPAAPVNFSRGGSSVPRDVAVDGSGNVWVSEVDSYISVTEFPASSRDSAASFGVGGNNPDGIALDSHNNIWVANLGNSSVTELAANNPDLAANFTGGGLNVPADLAIDGADNVWVANCAVTGCDGTSVSTVTELNSAGTALSPVSGFTGAAMNDAVGIAVDAAGNVWVANQGNSTVTEFLGVATPVKTPLAPPLSLAPRPRPPT
ncbi:MAG: NHL repeat-containing protein [Candidatus Binataceae bacterium]